MCEIPKFLRHLPTYKGLPIPYVQFIGDNGEPDFKVIHDENVAKCLKHRLCGICGRKLKDTFAFIGGEKSIKNGMFTDPAMHSECARYAAKTCPYLNGEKRSYSKAPPKADHIAEATLIDSEGVPKRLGIYYTNNYEYGTIPDQGAMIYIKAAPPLSIDWSAMPETAGVDSVEIGEDVFHQLIDSMPNNEGIVFLETIDDGHVIKRVTRENLAKLDQEQRFNVVCAFDRGLMGKYSEYLEHNYFPPDTPLNDELNIIFFKWQDMLWNIVSVPMARREWCFEAAAKCKMRLGNGTPRLLGVDLDESTTVAKFLPIELGIALGGKLDGASFPLESERTWTLEPIHEGATGPVLSVMVEKR